MSFNQRIVKYKSGGYGLVEVYYDPEGNPSMWTQAFCVGETLEELTAEYELYRRAFDKPILEVDE